MSPRKAARFSLGTLVVFKGDSLLDETFHVGTIIGTWTWNYLSLRKSIDSTSRIKSYGIDPRLDNESNGYLILSSDPKVNTQYMFYADVTLGNMSALETNESK